ncbi:uncharacterized protein LOC122250043 [Penaeus japonicus]|uniref:uncharacterized protein LOC122250043 n=1 Tax=Penaeus japonicus TaxID=27405 RepID=UPI001C70F4F7|nr:uncharacterized protein LOC122250043 [Penaeus japonicus]
MQNPWIDDTQHPWGDDTQNPWGDDTQNPWGDDTQNPWGDDTQNPWIDDTQNPWGDDTQHPWGDDTQHPWGDDTQNPWGDNTQNPWGDNTQNPWGDNTQNPWGVDTQNPWGVDMQNPWGDDTQHPWGDDTLNPWGEDTQDPWGDDTQIPWGDDTQYPWGDTEIPSDNSQNSLRYKKPTPWEAHTLIQREDDAKNPLGSDIHNTLRQGPQDTWNLGGNDNWKEDFSSPWGEDTDVQDSLEDSLVFQGDFDPQDPLSNYIDQLGVSDSAGGSFSSSLGSEIPTNRQEDPTGGNQEQDVIYYALEDILEQTKSYSNEKVPQFLSFLKPLEAGYSVDFTGGESGEEEEEEEDNVQNAGEYLNVEEYFDAHFTGKEKPGPPEPLTFPEMPKMEDQEDDKEGHMTQEMMEHLGLEVTNPQEVNMGKLYQMDMLIPEPQMEMVMKDMATNGTAGKKAISDVRYHWPAGPAGDPVVPYTFGDDKVNQTLCLRAMEEWMTHTCVKFEETEPSATGPHLQFIQGRGCYSYIGRIWFYKGQHVSIGINCGLYAAIHEVGHAIGLFHEQSRPDRDEEIRVNVENIKRSFRFNFEAARLNSVNNYGVKYDLTSIMHYKAKSYHNGGLTLSTVNPLHQELIGSMKQLSHRDKLLVNRMYKCIDKWLKLCNMKEDPCKNEGYVGVNCTCICPPGTCGEYCQHLFEDYYDTFLSGCSENITVASTIQSLEYPDSIPAGVKCTKWIVPPKCHKVELTFTRFSMYRRIRCQNRVSCCYWDGLEIRTKNPYTGTWYCGNEISPGRKFTSSKSIILYYHTSSRFSKGWKARVRFLPIEGCKEEGRAGTAKPFLPEELGRSVFNTMTIFSLNTSVNEPLPAKGDSGSCGLQEEFGNLYWNSPSYGFQKYPHDFSCFFTVVPNFPTAVRVKFDYFRVQPQIRDLCADSVDLIEPFGEEKKFCGSKTDKILLPSSALTARFASDNVYSFQGFNITFESRRKSACHKILNTVAGETGTITTPNYPGFHGQDCVCEWWIIAPATKKIRISIEGKRIGECKDNYLVVDLQGSRSYYRPLSSRFCGENNLPTSLLSSNNELNVVYKSVRNSKGFHIQYEVV